MREIFRHVLRRKHFSGDANRESEAEESGRDPAGDRRIGGTSHGAAGRRDHPHNHRSHQISTAPIPAAKIFQEFEISEE